MEIRRIDTYTDDRFSKTVLSQHGAYLIGEEPYEVKITGPSEAIVRGRDPDSYLQLIEEFRFHAPHITRFYDEDHHVIIKYPDIDLLEIRLDQIQPSQFFIDEAKLEAVRSFVRDGDDVVIQEREVIRLIVNYGMCYLTDTEYDDGTVRPTTVLEYINNEINIEQINFSDPLYKHTFELALQCIPQYYKDLEGFNVKLEEDTRKFIEEEMAAQDEEVFDAMDSEALINAQDNKEKAIRAKASLKAKNELMDYSCSYLIKVLCSIDDDAVRQLACDLATDNLPQLSKIHTQYAVILEERDKLLRLVPERLYNWLNALLVQKINETKSQIATAGGDELPQLMEYLQKLYNARHELASYIGERVVNPK